MKRILKNNQEIIVLISVLVISGFLIWKLSDWSLFVFSIAAALGGHYFCRLLSPHMLSAGYVAESDDFTSKMAGTLTLLAFGMPFVPLARHLEEGMPTPVVMWHWIAITYALHYVYVIYVGLRVHQIEKALKIVGNAA